MCKALDKQSWHGTITVRFWCRKTLRLCQGMTKPCKFATLVDKWMLSRIAWSWTWLQVCPWLTDAVTLIMSPTRVMKEPSSDCSEVPHAINSKSALQYARTPFYIKGWLLCAEQGFVRLKNWNFTMQTFSFNKMAHESWQSVTRTEKTGHVAVNRNFTYQWVHSNYSD